MKDFLNFSKKKVNHGKIIGIKAQSKTSWPLLSERTWSKNKGEATDIENIFLSLTSKIISRLYKGLSNSTVGGRGGEGEYPPMIE